MFIGYMFKRGKKTWKVIHSYAINCVSYLPTVSLRHNEGIGVKVNSRPGFQNWQNFTLRFYDLGWEIPNVMGICLPFFSALKRCH